MLSILPISVISWKQILERCCLQCSGLWKTQASSKSCFRQRHPDILQAKGTLRAVAEGETWGLACPTAPVVRSLPCSQPTVQKFTVVTEGSPSTGATSFPILQGCTATGKGHHWVPVQLFPASFCLPTPPGLQSCQYKWAGLEKLFHRRAALAVVLVRKLCRWRCLLSQSLVQPPLLPVLRLGREVGWGCVLL